MSHAIRTTLAAMLTALAAAPAFAQVASTPAPQAFEVMAMRPRVDVSSLCPAIHTQLADALARTFNESGQRGMVDVLLMVSGGHVGKVQTLEGPLPLQRAVRLAVRRSVECSTEEQAPQYVFFRVDFPDESLERTAGTPGPAAIVVAQR